MLKKVFEILMHLKKSIVK